MTCLLKLLTRLRILKKDRPISYDYTFSVSEAIAEPWYIFEVFDSCPVCCWFTYTQRNRIVGWPAAAGLFDGRMNGNNASRSWLLNWNGWRVRSLISSSCERRVNSSPTGICNIVVDLKARNHWRKWPALYRVELYNAGDALIIVYIGKTHTIQNKREKLSSLYIIERKAKKRYVSLFLSL